MTGETPEVRSDKRKQQFTSDIYFQFGVNMHKSDLVHWQRGNTEMN